MLGRKDPREDGFRRSRLVVALKSDLDTRVSYEIYKDVDVDTQVVEQQLGRPSIAP